MTFWIGFSVVVAALVTVAYLYGKNREREKAWKELAKIQRKADDLLDEVKSMSDSDLDDELRNGPP